MKFRPCIDLRLGKVVQIVGGTLDDNDQNSTKVNFESEKSPAEYAQLYREHDLTGAHVIALGAGNETAAQLALSAWPQGLQMGGGVQPENAQMWIDRGASHVIVTSCVFKNGQLHEGQLKKLVDIVGKDKLVLDLSCRKREGSYYIVTDRWQKFTELEVSPATLLYLSEYCAEFLVHGADVEGLRAGMEEPLIRMLGQHSPIPVTYAGGAKSLADFDAVEELGQGRVDLTMGSALDIFGGEVSFDAVVKWHRVRNP
jgi:phosphoribosylformimino-5-aminoimidazole carboxamide ribotide isomerase